MSEPVEFQIVKHLQAALQAIRVADGYHYDVRGTGVKLNPEHDVEALVDPDAPRPFVFLEVTPGTWTYMPAGRVKLGLAVRLHWFHEADPEVDDDMVRMFYRGCSDLEKAVAADITRGGLAVDTRVVQCTNTRDTGATAVWAMVDLEIAVIRTYGAATV